MKSVIFKDGRPFKFMSTHELVHLETFEVEGQLPGHAVRRLDGTPFADRSGLMDMPGLEDFDVACALA